MWEKPFVRYRTLFERRRYGCQFRRIRKSHVRDIHSGSATVSFLKRFHGLKHGRRMEGFGERTIVAHIEGSRPRRLSGANCGGRFFGFGCQGGISSRMRSAADIALSRIG